MRSLSHLFVAGLFLLFYAGANGAEPNTAFESFDAETADWSVKVVPEPEAKTTFVEDDGRKCLRVEGNFFPGGDATAGTVTVASTAFGREIMPSMDHQLVITVDAKASQPDRRLRCWLSDSKNLVHLVGTGVVQTEWAPVEFVIEPETLQSPTGVAWPIKYFRLIFENGKNLGENDETLWIDQIKIEQRWSQPCGDQSAAEFSSNS